MDIIDFYDNYNNYVIGQPYALPRVPDLNRIPESPNLTSYDLFNELISCYSLENHDYTGPLFITFEAKINSVLNKDPTDAIAWRTLGLFKYINANNDSEKKTYASQVLNKAIELGDTGSIVIKYHFTENIKIARHILENACRRNNSDALYTKAKDLCSDKSTMCNLMLLSIKYHDDNCPIFSMHDKMHFLIDNNLENYVYDHVVSIDEWILNIIFMSDIHCTPVFNFIDRVLTRYHEIHGSDKFFKGILETGFYTESQKKKFEPKKILKEIHLDIIKDNCCICIGALMNSSSSVIILNCGHVFHYDCVCSQKVCPLCRNEIYLNK